MPVVSPTAQTSPVAVACPTRLVFVAGWAEETFAVSRRIQRVVRESSRVSLPHLFLYESLKGDAIFMPQFPGLHQEAELGQGLLLDPHPSLDPIEFMREFSRHGGDEITVIRVVLKDDGGEVDALTFSKYFPKSQAPASLIPCGSWLKRPLPFPLVNLELEELMQVRNIFAYGTLRYDDTSGASWTQPFNENMCSEHAVIWGVSLYLQTYPILLIPRYDGHTNTGTVGCVVTCDNDELFSEKLAFADRIEGSPSLYRRGVVRALTKSGKSVLSFVYYRSLDQIGGDTHRFLKSRIESGNFLRRGAEFEFVTSEGKQP